jgi:hypothetical protein
MKDDYLWDKSGEPEPEIERLEQLLGGLRYRRPATPLPLPRRAPEQARRSFRPALAIAATLSFVMLAAGLWFALGRGQRAAGVLAVNAQPGRARDWLDPETWMTPTIADESLRLGPVINENAAQRPNAQRRFDARRRREQSNGARFANSPSIERDERISMDEGIAAREQLIKALHLASTKLNQVQKKIQDNKSTGPVS